MYDGLDPRHTEHNFGRGSPKAHLGKVWLKLTKWFQRYMFFCMCNSQKKLPVGDGDDPPGA